MLYVVATPIGNLEDITYRAVRVLREAGAIACEDTRQTRKLLERYGITTPTLSYHEHNEESRTQDLLRRLAAGETIALVSDAGTPLIADPGYRLVAAARAAGIAVVPIPGPNAALAALSAGGLPTDSFRFGGFLPQKQSQRLELLRALARDQSTLVFYEAPHRIVEALEDIAAAMPARPVTLAREITKVHEEFLTGAAAGLAAQLRERGAVRGEFTVLIGKSPDAPAPDHRPLAEAVAELEHAGIPRMDAIKQVARDRGLAKRDVYQQLSVKR